MGDHSRMLVLLVAVCLGTETGVHTARLHRRQLSFGQNQGGSDTRVQSPDTGVRSQDTRVQSPDTQVQRQEFGEQIPNTRIFGLLGGLFGGGDDCVCVTDEDEEMTERQVEVGQKFFFGGGGSDCNCPTDEGSGSGPTDETVRDCKGREEGDTYYDCGCGGGGGLFGFGRKKRQSQSDESINTRFLDFRCIGAAILGRQAN